MVYRIDRADDGFHGAYADQMRVWNFLTAVVDKLGRDQAQLQALLNTLAPTKFANPVYVA